MRPFHTLALLALSLMSTAAAASPGHQHAHDDATAQAYGQPGDPKQPARIVQIVMREADGRMMFVPDRLVVRSGEQIRFRLRNDGEIDHELVLATVEQNLAHMKRSEASHDLNKYIPYFFLFNVGLPLLISAYFLVNISVVCILHN